MPGWLVFHGLRKSAVVMLLEGGCTTAEVQAITGQSMQMVEHYAKKVSQKRWGRLLNIEWRPEQGRLDIWSGRRVLSVERFRGKPQVIHYVPGPWELHLINAAKVAA